MNGEAAAAPAAFVNGIDGATGDSLLPPLSADSVSALALGERLDPSEIAELRARIENTQLEAFTFIRGVDPTDLADVGWGVVFAHDADPAIREALGPLLDRRKEQASAQDPRRYREFNGPDAHRPNETHRAWLSRHDVLPENPVVPERVPYYLLIVGDPERIPFRFQYGLDVAYAVGRIAFDTVEEYARYSESVVRAETEATARTRMALFGARNEDDLATSLSADHLVLPLAERLVAKHPDWTFTRNVGAGEGVDGPATKAALHGLLNTGEVPSVLFSATHGLAFPRNDPRQRDHQGGLICQDWPGRRRWGGRAISEDLYFGAGDTADIDPSGMIAFLFACYGAGTPRHDDFVYEALGAPSEIAPRAFLGRLPERLLAHSKGSALAVVGHVERAWSFSFMWPGLGEQIDVFEGMLGSVLDGAPVGSALELLNLKYSALTAELDSAREDVKFGRKPDRVGLSGMWTAKNDARNYVVVGDPAVRLPARAANRP